MDVCAPQHWSRKSGAHFTAAAVDKLVSPAVGMPTELKAFLLDFAAKIYRPVFEASDDERWDVLQEILMGPLDDALARFPEEPEVPPHRRTVEMYARSLSRAFEDGPLAEVLQTGANYRKRRDDLLERRGEELVGNNFAGMAYTASRGFFWALFLIGLSDFFASESALELSDDDRGFILFILEIGGEDQYILLRVAENELLDQEEERTLVVEGDISPEAQEMENDAHQSWADIQKKTRP